jgi:hypothetical protein
MLDDLYLEAKEQVKFSNYCLIGQWSMSLSESDKAAFDTSINDVDFSTRGLFKLYKKAGATFGLSSLLIHRNGECGCP